MWYFLLKQSDELQHGRDPWWMQGYLSHGHDWTSSDFDEKDTRTAKMPPQNPNDAVWIFRNGQLEVMTAGEWHAKGNRGFTFVHDDVFKEHGNRPGKEVFSGRFDAKKNIVSIKKVDTLARNSSLMYRVLSQKFPGARIMEF